MVSAFRARLKSLSCRLDCSARPAIRCTTYDDYFDQGRDRDGAPASRGGLKKYLWLQAQRDTCDVRSNPGYRRRFNGFYRVRRGRDWQDKFFDLLERKKGQTVPFAEVLDTLHRTTGRYEASFASKL